MTLATMPVACSTSAHTASSPIHSPVPVSSLPSVSPSPSPTPPTPMPASPAPAPVAAPAPTSIAVGFSGLPRGSYPVHIHSACSGRQVFHITVVQSLVVASGGSGAIDVPSSYLARGLCLIVYTSPSLSAVLKTRPI